MAKKLGMKDGEPADEDGVSGDSEHTDEVNTDDS